MDIPTQLQNVDLEFKQQELRNKKLDGDIKEQELKGKEEEAKKKGGRWAWLTNPVGLAILASLLAILGSLVTWSLNQSAERQKHEATEKLEKMKLDGNLILEALKTGAGDDKAKQAANLIQRGGLARANPLVDDKAKQAAANLILLADAKLVTFDEGVLNKLRETAGPVKAGLPSASGSAAEPLDERAYAKIRADVGDAVAVLNVLFEKQLPPPRVKPSAFEGSSYYDPATQTVHVPPAVQYIPDLAYREVAHMYRPIWQYEGQSGALGSSIADVLATVVTQRRKQQTAQTAEWVLYRNGVAWGRGENLTRSTDAAPLHSLRAPGTAYNDPAFGKDPQVDHMTRYVAPDPNINDVMINSGIPNKAFYEVAMKLGTDRAVAVWIKAMNGITGTKPTFAEFAKETASQAEKLHGAAAKQAVLDGWKVVGIEPAK